LSNGTLFSNKFGSLKQRT